MNYLIDNNYAKEINEELWIEKSDLLKLCGYKYFNSLKLNKVITLIDNDKIYINIDQAINILKNQYNKRNPYLIDLHKELLFENMDYSIEAKTLHPIITYLNKKNIECLFQYTNENINRKIDLFIPKYKIAIECDEHNHIDREPINENIRDSELKLNNIKIIKYDPHAKNFDVNVVINNIIKCIEEQKYTTCTLDELKTLLRDYNETNLESKYYEKFGNSLYGDGYIVDFDNVWNCVDIVKNVMQKIFS